MKTTKLITLTAIRDKCESGNYKGFSFTRLFKGRKLVATFPPEQKQPRYGQKTITLNCWKWKLVWLTAMLMLTVSFAHAQTKVTVKGNELVSVKSVKSDTGTHSIISNATMTKYNFHLKSGESLPVWISKNGKYFVVRQPKNGGEPYRQYLQIEQL